MAVQTKTVKSIIPATTQASESIPKVLTIIVTDSESVLVSGARVTMQPSGATGLTDNSGQIQFQIGSASKYDVTVTLGKDTVTVPYYVTAGGATKLMVNVTYVKKAEALIAQGQQGRIGQHAGVILGVGFGVIVVVIILWVLIRKRR